MGPFVNLIEDTVFGMDLESGSYLANYWQLNRSTLYTRIDRTPNFCQILDFEAKQKLLTGRLIQVLWSSGYRVVRSES